MKADFINRVMQVMNELGWNDSEGVTYIGSDTNKLSENIEIVFVDAWRRAVNILPKTYFNISDFSTSPIDSNTHDGTGRIILPADFYALFQFRMSGWRKAVETMIDFSDTVASVQANEFSRGNTVRPVCVRNFVNNAVVLEYYSLPKGIEHKVEKALYIPFIGYLSDATVILDKLFVPLAYLCAAQVYYLFEKPDIAQLLEQKSLEIII